MWLLLCPGAPDSPGFGSPSKPGSRLPASLRHLVRQNVTQLPPACWGASLSREALCDTKCCVCAVWAVEEAAARLSTGRATHVTWQDCATPAQHSITVNVCQGRARHTTLAIRTNHADSPPPLPNILLQVMRTAGIRIDGEMADEIASEYHRPGTPSSVDYNSFISAQLTHGTGAGHAGGWGGVSPKHGSGRSTARHTARSTTMAV